MSSETVLSFLALMLGAGGIGAALIKLVEYWLKRAEHHGVIGEAREEKEEIVDVALAQAQVSDASAMRAELWAKLDQSMLRNEVLAQRISDLLQENGALQGQIALLREQYVQTVGKLSTVLVQLEEYKYQHIKAVTERKQIIGGE